MHTTDLDKLLEREAREIAELKQKLYDALYNKTDAMTDTEAEILIALHEDKKKIEKNRQHLEERAIALKKMKPNDEEKKAQTD